MLKLPEKMKRIPSGLKWIMSKHTSYLVLGLVLGIAGLLLVQSYNPADERSTMASTVFGRLVEQNEMVTVSQKYSIVDKVEDTNKLFDFIDIPFTKNSFWYRYTRHA